MLFRNKKNGKLYKVQAEAVDCTNARDGTPVYIYAPVDDPRVLSVREKTEFLLKFDPVDPGEGT